MLYPLHDSGPHLSIMAANYLIQACPVLRYIGRIATWGRVEREELEAMQREAASRNLNIILE